MVLVVVTLVVGIAVGYLHSGRLRRLADVRLSRLWLLAVAFGAQSLLNGLAAPGVATGALGTGLLLGSLLAVIAFVWANRTLPGMALVAAGFLLNAVTIVANGAMPVSRTAMAAVTAEPVRITVGKHRLLAPGDALPWLADVIPIPWLRTVVSVGDLVSAVGVAVLVASLMAPSGRHRDVGRRRVGAGAHRCTGADG